MVNGFTNHVVNMKDGVIIIKKVPCTECMQCGQSFYDDDVMGQLETIVNEMKKSITEVAIVNYTNKVA
jgi:YgiT-type zinc finger domain-containing protein